MRFVIVLLCVFCFALFSTPAPGAAPLARGSFSALHFDGIDDYVRVDDPIQATTGPLSLEAWVWLDSLSSGGRIVGDRDDATGYEIDIYPDEGGGFDFRLTFGNSVALDAILAVQPRQWVHLAATWAGTSLTTLKLYANGEVVASGDRSFEIPPSTGSVLIGTLAANQGFFEGVIDDVRIWSVALDQATIQAWMSRPVDAPHPNFANLEGYWKFDEGSGQAAASFTHSPDLDGQLGSAPGEDSSDPTWTTNVSPVPVEPTTFGWIKWIWLLGR